MVPPCSDRISRVPPYSRVDAALPIRGYHPLRRDFPDASSYFTSTTGLIPVRSPLLGESHLMSFPPGTEMFQFPGFASLAGYSLRSGFPHSEIVGSKLAHSSPTLIAACHVLHRLLSPRHPQNALKTLDYSRLHPRAAIGHLIRFGLSSTRLEDDILPAVGFTSKTPPQVRPVDSGFNGPRGR